MSELHTSEITRFREQQALEEESARLALTGYAITARHDFITARAQRGAERILQLIEEGKHAEAEALMNTDNWGVENMDTATRGKPKTSCVKLNFNQFPHWPSVSTT